MSALSNHAEDLVLDWLFTTDPVTRPTGWYAALHDGDPGETGANEVTTSEDADYVRKSITFGSSSSGATLSASQVSWTVASDSAGYTVTHISIWDAATAGNCLIAGALVQSKALEADGVLTFEIGEIVATAD